MFRFLLLIAPLFIALLFNVSLSATSSHEKTSLIVCENSLEMFAWDLDFISEATQSIELSACFTGGKIFQALIEAIRERLERCPAIQVYVMAAPPLLDDEDREMLSILSTQYPNNFHFQFTDNVLVSLSSYTPIDNHIKGLVVDEHYFALGGTNLDVSQCTEGSFTPPRVVGGNRSRDLLPAGMRDQDVVGKGPIAREFRRSFHQQFALWESYFKSGYFEKDPERFADNHFFEVDGSMKPTVTRFEDSLDLIEVSSAKLIVSGPMDCPNKITEEYMRLVEKATFEIVIGNPYLAPVDPLFHAMIQAAKRGVATTVITNGTFEGAPRVTDFFCWSNRIHYVPFFYGKEFRIWESKSAQKMPLCRTKIFEYRVKDVLYHKKVMVIDRRYTVVGSYNLGLRSDQGDYELILVIDSPQIASDFLKVIEKDKKCSCEILPSEARDWYFNLTTAYIGSVEKLFSGFF